MIPQLKYSDYHIPCKIRDTTLVEIYVVNALSFTHACRILLNVLDNEYIIGFGSM